MRELRNPVPDRPKHELSGMTHQSALPRWAKILSVGVLAIFALTQVGCYHAPTLAGAANPQETLFVAATKCLRDANKTLDVEGAKEFCLTALQVEGARSIEAVKAVSSALAALRRSSYSAVWTPTPLCAQTTDGCPPEK